MADDEADSADEALYELLGLESLTIDCELDEPDVTVPESMADLTKRLDKLHSDWLSPIQAEYQAHSVCILPSSLSIPASIMRHITDELVWGGPEVTVDRSYEAITVLKGGHVLEKRTLTRLENFVAGHDEWQQLCRDYIQPLVSTIIGEPLLLFKEKLNLKPPGGAGFAPHLDTPSLRMALGQDGPRRFWTIMIAIDAMHAGNGCLRVCRGQWTEETALSTVAHEPNGNPDASGRAGALEASTADKLDFTDIECEGGTIAIFNGWAPHRSSANTSPFARRAVFLTYTPANEGDFHARYYENMADLRRQWRQRVGLQPQLSPEEQCELDALATIPRI